MPTKGSAASIGPNLDDASKAQPRRLRVDARAMLGVLHRLGPQGVPLFGKIGVVVVDALQAVGALLDDLAGDLARPLHRFHDRGKAVARAVGLLGPGLAPGVALPPMQRATK